MSSLSAKVIEDYDSQYRSKTLSLLQHRSLPVQRHGNCEDRPMKWLFHLSFEDFSCPDAERGSGHSCHTLLARRANVGPRTEAATFSVAASAKFNPSTL